MMDSSSSSYSPPPPPPHPHPYSPRKRSRRRSKDKIRELHLLPLTPPANLSPIHDVELDLHAWGLGDLKKDLHQLHSIANKYLEGNTAAAAVAAIPLLGDQLYKWKTKRIKSQLVSCWNVTVSKLLQGEYTFHIWLEAIQTKKRIIRLEALRRVDDLEALIEFHEYRLDGIDDRMDECKSLAVTLKKQCNILSAMKLFIDEQLIRIPHPVEVIQDETEEEIVFKGYSFDSGRAVRPSDIVSAQNELSHMSLSKQNFRSRQSSSASVFSDHQIDVDAEISEKLAISIELVNRCSSLQEHIRQNQKKEMVTLSITWRCRSILRHLCEFSLDIHGPTNITSELTNINDGSIQGSGVGELTINRESRELSGSDSFGDDNPLQFTKSSRKTILKSTRDMIALMEVLTEQEAKSKGYLQKLAEYKQELSAIKFELENYLPPDSKWELIDVNFASLACNIVMGYHEPISSEFTPTLVVDKCAPLSCHYPYLQGVFENVERDFPIFLKSFPPHTSVYAKELSLCDLKNLMDTFSTNSLVIEPLQCELESYLRNQGLPPPWISPTLGKIRSQSVDFDLPDTPYLNELSCGCGLIAYLSAPGATSIEFLVGIENICAVYATSFLYRNIFSALALRDYLMDSFQISLPLFVLDRLEAAEAKFILLTADRLDCILKAFLEDNLATKPTYQLDFLPGPYKINLQSFSNLNNINKLRLFCSLRCSNNILSELFTSEDPSQFFFDGITLAINSWNPDAAKELVLAGAKFLSINPQFASKGDPNLTSWRQTEIHLAPLEDLVDIVSKYDMSSNRQHRQSDLFIPLAAVRILLVAVNKQTFHRYCECCEQLAQRIHLSSIVTLQLFRSARISRPSSSSSLCGMKEEPTNPMLKIDLHIRPSPLDDPIPKRVPLAGSVTVSSRTELYHDLMNFHLYSFDDSKSTFRDLNSLRTSIQMCDQSLENTIRHIYFLCSITENLLADSNSWLPPYIPFESLSLTKRQYSVLFSIRNDIRLNILQYILGLDERWSIEATVSSCSFVKKCLELHYPDLVNLKSPSLLRISCRKSQLYPSPTVNLLCLALPSDVLALNCHILYSLNEDGAGIASLRPHLRENYQHLLLFIQDSYGYLFGAFLSLLPQHPSTILSEKSFYFRALPDFKIFPLPDREEGSHYAPWISSSGIHIGPASTTSPSINLSSSAILYLDPSFSFGHTSPPDSSMSLERLSLAEEFKSRLFEVWAFSPATE